MKRRGPCLVALLVLGVLSGLGHLNEPAVGAQTSSPATIPACPTPSSTTPSTGFTGTFASDQRPTSLLYLSLTQAGSSVSGYLSLVLPDKKGGTTSQTFLIQGTATGDSAILNLSYPIGRSAQYTGQRQGCGLVLSEPTSTGQIITVVFSPTTPTVFNEMVTSWRQQLAATQATQVAVQATAKAQAAADQATATAQAAIPAGWARQVQQLAQKLADDIDTLNSATDDINGHLADTRDALQTEQKDLDKMRADFVQEQQDAAVRPMDCYQATDSVEYDYKFDLNYHYQFDFKPDHDQFVSVALDVTHNLSHVTKRIADTHADAQALADALAADPYPLPKLAAKPGDEQSALATYQATADAATKELASLQASDQQVQQDVQDMLTQGKTIVDGAKILAGGC